MDTLVLRLAGPLMAFGDVMVDKRGPVRPFPARSMITGLLANALGWDHGEKASLQSLQQRLLLAVRLDREGVLLTDYQTVDLGQDFLCKPMWTTRGAPEWREGGNAKTGTHIRLRDYWADAVCTVVIALASPEASPTLEEVAEALRFPARPLFLGRKGCPPSRPILVGALAAANLREALELASWEGEGSRQARAWWPELSGEPTGLASPEPITDERDWENQIHCGKRFLHQGVVERTAGGDP